MALAELMPIPLIVGGAIALAKTFAPSLIGRLAGPRAGAVAEKVVGIAAALTGEANPDLALKILQENPELLARFEIRMAEVDLEERRIHAEDRKGARAMLGRLAELGHAAVAAPVLVSAIVTGGFVGMLYAMIYEPVPAANKDVVMLLVGALVIAFGQVVNFWMGSSKSSQDKTGLIARLTGGGNS